MASSWASTACPSAKPQLIDTTDTPGRLAAVATLVIRSASDWLLASTSTICAPGAMAWAHSTSSASSISQLPRRPGRIGGRQAARLAVLIDHRQERRRRTVLMVQRRAGGGLPNWLSNVSSAEDGRIVVGIDDGDRLARAVQRQVVDAVGGAHLGRRCRPCAVAADRAF